MVTAPPSRSIKRFSRFIGETMGLYFCDQRLPELEQKMVRVSADLGFARLDECLLRLMAGPLTGEQLETLARHLTVGETYFLRDLHSYQVLEQTLLPRLIEKRRQEGKRLRIWSAGCSTGEEPYTIAILLKRLLPDLESWQISLVGSDINKGSLEKARHGVYGAWSFRNAPEWLMGYFRKRPDGRFKISESLRKMVTFAQLNLVTDDFRSLFPEGEVDIVFCRNVLLYLGQHARERVVGGIHDILSDEGDLFVSPTEVDHGLFRAFTCRRFPGAFVFSKGREAEFATAECAAAGVSYEPARFAAAAKAADAFSLPAPAPADGCPPFPAPEANVSVDMGLAAPDGGAVSGVPCVETDPVAAEGKGEADLLAAEAKRYAGLGRLAEARRLCEQAIAADRLRAGNHYLLSTIQEEQGLVEEAIASLKKALYLDQDFLLAHFALGNLDRRAGRRAASRRHFDNALRLLEARDCHEVLPEAEGLTAGLLAEVVRRNLQEDHR